MCISIPGAAEYSMSTSILPIVCGIVSFSYTKVEPGSPGMQDILSIPTTKHLRSHVWVSQGRGVALKLTNSIYHLVFRESAQQELVNFMCNVVLGTFYIKMTTCNAQLSCNTSTMWSRKSVRYQSALTVQVLQPDSG